MNYYVKADSRGHKLSRQRRTGAITWPLAPGLLATLAAIAGIMTVLLRPRNGSVPHARGNKAQANIALALAAKAEAHPYQYKSTPSHMEEPPLQASIHGHVVTPDEVPLENATVCIANMVGELGNPERCIHTDSDGRFTIGELQRTPASLIVSALGFVTRVQKLEARIELQPNAYEIRLEPELAGVAVSGLVNDLYGGPIEGAVISVMTEVEEEHAGVTLSGAQGRFALSVDRGAVRLCARAEAYARVCREFLAPSEHNSLVLMPESEIVGRVVTATTGRGVGGATVTAANRNGLRVPPTTVISGSDGSFALAALPPGKYSVAAVHERGRSADASMVLGAGETSQPVTLTTFAAVRLRAKVLLGDEPCQNGHVRVLGPIHIAQHLRTDGTADIDGLLPGTYSALAVCHGRPSATLLDIGDASVEHTWTFAEKSESEEPATAAGEHADEALLVPRRGTIRVTLSNEEITDEPIRVFANGRTPMTVSSRQSGGEHIFDSLTAGEYFIHPFDDVERAVSVRLDGSGDTVKVRMDLPSRGLISGRVTDQRGEGVSNAWVSYARADLPTGEMMVGSPVLTDDEGAFALPVTPGAPYSLEVNSPAGDARHESARGGQRLDIRVSPEIHERTN